MATQTLSKPLYLNSEELSSQITIAKAQISSQELKNAIIELETRFGSYSGNTFISNIEKSTYQRLLRSLSITTTPVIQRSTDYISNTVRKSVFHNLAGESKSTHWIVKRNIYTANNADYNIRTSINLEYDVEEVKDFTPEVIRNKNRSSFTFPGGYSRLDLTEVIMASDGKQRSTYEMELELLNITTEGNITEMLKKYSSLIDVVMAKYQDSKIAYWGGIIDGVKQRFSRTLGKALDYGTIVQARNLKLRDMTWGGLIGNPREQYTVTHKADGLRKLLFFDITGLWLLMPNSANWLKTAEGMNNSIFGSILDGELITHSKMSETLSKEMKEKKVEYLYLIFDCIRSGGENVENKPHRNRMEHAQSIIDSYKPKSSSIMIKTKRFESFITVEQFNSTMRKMFFEQKSLGYEQDGFMFTPEFSTYNPHSDRLELHQRILTKYPDICKWKPKEKLSIDFLVQWNMTPTGAVPIFYTKAIENAIFTGSDISPFNATTMVDMKLTNPSNIPTGTIVEFAWNYETKMLYPIQMRPDKKTPNKSDIATDVWNDIQKPIERETLTGDSIDLMRYYHNKIKRGVYNSISKGTLLDLGSGRGGDVSKWGKFSKIVAVEPNPDNIVELRRRVELHKLTDRVLIIQAGAEDTKVITDAVRGFIGGPVNTISSMLSMSFLWSSKEVMTAFANTIKENLSVGGNFIFMTIDGDAVKQLFRPAGTNIEFNPIELGDTKIKLTYKEPNQLNIVLPGTIVETQDEWLVHLTDLTTALGAKFNMLEYYRADGEKFLSVKEALLSRIYSFGRINRS